MTSYANQVTIKAVGMRAGGREAVVANASLGMPATLIPEPSNRFDRNAIKIHLGGPEVDHDESTQIGYVPKEVAKLFKLPSPVAAVISALRFPPEGSDARPDRPVGCDVSAQIGDFRVG